MDNEVKLTFKNEIKGTTVKTLEKYKDTLVQINAVLNGLNMGVAKELEDGASNTKEIANSLKDMKKKTDVAFNYTTVRAFTRGLQRLTQAMGSYVNKSATYLENMNLLDVAYNNNTESASKFVNKLSEMYGLDESWGYRTVGIFKQLSNAMGLTAKMGDKVSETMTQFAIDVSSLYNIDTSDAVSILTSALAGQTKPARRLGADITQATLQTTLDEAGIDKQIGDLSYAEKRLVIIASLLGQVKEANGDWGRTIESVANQTRIMSEQWDRLTRNFGNMLLPVVKKILPYVNGILMALTEIFGVIASLLGYDEDDFDYFGQIDSSAIDLSDDIANATDNTEKLKKSMLGLRSFDKLINIATPKKDSSTGTSGLGVSTDIAKLANEQMDLYNAKLDSVEMKATKIRDSIMEWFGFTKQVDEETGKISWKFDHITSGTVLGGFIIGGAIFNGVAKIIEIVGKFTGAGGGMSLVNKKALTWAGIITGIVSGYGLIKQAVKDYSKDSDKAFKEQEIGIGLLMGSFALLGSKISWLGSYGGPVGLLVGSFAGLFISVNEGMKQIQAAYDSTRKAGEKYLDQLNKENDQIKQNLDLQITALESNTKYVDKLGDLLDANGQVKKGFEDRAETYLKLINEAYGTDYELSGRQITQNKKVVKSIEQINNEVQKTIDKKKTEYVIEAYKDEYIKNLKTRKEAQEELNKKQETYNTMLKKWQENEKEAAEYYGVSRKELKKSLDRQKEGLESLQTAIGKYDDEIKNYEDLMEGHIEGNVKKVDKALEHYGVQTKTNLEKTTKEVQTNTKKVIENIKTNFKDPVKLVFTSDMSKVETSLNKLFEKNPLLKPLANAFKDLKLYANGGLPQVGQLFVAGEKGPELVGSIGNQTFVANQSQIPNLFKNSNNQSNSSKTNQVYNIYLDKNHLIASYTLEQLNSMAKSNGKPITIGG